MFKTGSSESTFMKRPHCRKSRVAANILKICEYDQEIPQSQNESTKKLKLKSVNIFLV